jgi:hypothetical protein
MQKALRVAGTAAAAVVVLGLILVGAWQALARGATPR